MDLLRGIFMTLVTKSDQIHPKEKAWYPLVIKHWKIHHLVSWFPNLKDVKKAISSRISSRVWYVTCKYIYIHNHIIIIYCNIYIQHVYRYGPRTKDQRIDTQHWMDWGSKIASFIGPLMLLDIAGGTEQNHFTADRLEAQGLGEWDPQSRTRRISRSIKIWVNYNELTTSEPWKS